MTSASGTATIFANIRQFRQLEGAQAEDLQPAGGGRCEKFARTIETTNATTLAGGLAQGESIFDEALARKWICPRELFLAPRRNGGDSGCFKGYLVRGGRFPGIDVALTHPSPSCTTGA